MPREKQDTVNLMTRLPPDVHAALVQSASENERSLNAQIIVILRRFLFRPAPKSKRPR